MCAWERVFVADRCASFFSENSREVTRTIPSSYSECREELSEKELEVGDCASSTMRMSFSSDAAVEELGVAILCYYGHLTLGF